METFERFLWNLAQLCVVAIAVVATACAGCLVTWLCLPYLGGWALAPGVAAMLVVLAGIVTL